MWPVKSRCQDEEEYSDRHTMPTMLHVVISLAFEVLAVSFSAGAK